MAPTWPTAIAVVRRRLLESAGAGSSPPADTTGEAKTLSLSTLEATGDAILAEEVASEDEVNAALARSCDSRLRGRRYGLDRSPRSRCGRGGERLGARGGRLAL